MPNDAIVSGQSVNPEYDEAAENAQTYEECMQKKLDEQRERLNRTEANFARLPVAIRRMTRGQAIGVGLYF